MMDTVMPHGYVEIRMYDKYRNLLKVYRSHNQITVACLDLAFNRGLGSLFKCGGDLFGQVYTLDSFNGVDNDGARYHTPDSTIHIGLLSLGTKKNSLTKESSIANFYSEDFDSLDNVIGYAGVNVTPAGNKEGKLIFSRGSAVAAANTREMGWEFPINVAGGTFDTVVLTSKKTLTTPYPVEDGVVSYKCIDKVNVLDPNFVSKSTAYCPPGVIGVTSDTEILLNFDDGAGNRWKYNMTTGEVTAVPVGQPFFTPVDNNVDDWFIEDNYLYTVSKTGSSASSMVSQTIKVWDITTQTQVDSFSASESSNSYTRHRKFFKHNGNVYLTMNSTHTSSSSTRRCWKLNKGSSGYYSSATAGSSIEATIGITLPSGLDVKQVALGNSGNNTIVYIGDAGVVVSDINNMAATLIDVIPLIRPGVIAFGSGSNMGFLSVGVPDGVNSMPSSKNTVSPTDSLWVLGTENISIAASGICLMTKGHWGTMTSYHVFNEPITKTDNLIMRAFWVYNFTGDSESARIYQWE